MPPSAASAFTAACFLLRNRLQGLGRAAAVRKPAEQTPEFSSEDDPANLAAVAEASKEIEDQKHRVLRQVFKWSTVYFAALGYLFYRCDLPMLCVMNSALSINSLVMFMISKAI